MLYGTKNPHGGDIYDREILYDFSANTNPFGTPEGVKEAMIRALSRVHHYPDPYCRELVGAISGFEAVPEDYVLCGNGAAELIYAYCDAVRPKRALELAPTFSEYSLGLDRVGCGVERYFLKKERDFQPDGDLLRAVEQKKPDVIFLCNPNNPTGQLLPEGLLRKLLSLCQQKGIRLFLDECFLDLTEEGVSMKSALGEHPELLILKAFTKSYGMAGVRLGYCMSADSALLTRMSRTVQPWNVSMLAQSAGVAALGETEFLRNTRALIRRERAWLKENLEALGFRVCPSRVNFLLFHGQPGLCEPLREQGIALRNCDNYHGLEPGWYRCAVRQRRENQALITALASLTGKE